MQVNCSLKEKLHKLLDIYIQLYRYDEDTCFCHRKNCDGIGFCARGYYECRQTEDCDKMAKCSNAQCLCTQHNLCENATDTLLLCDVAHAGTESKALMIVASLFVSLILNKEFHAK